MTQVDRSLKLVQTKLALAEKYERLGKLASSETKRKHCQFHANKYRQQAGNLSRK